MPTKKITVKDILELMWENDRVIVRFYAYGIPCANTWEDNMETVSECLFNMRYECLNAKVRRIDRNWARGYKDGVPEDKTDQWIEIHADMTH